MRLRIHDVIGSDSAFDTDQGLIVRKAYSHLGIDERLILDFTDIHRVSPSFLSQALLPLLLDQSPEQISTRIEFESKPDGFEYAWQNVIKAITAQRKLGKKPH
jgi:hypothetical protein